MPDDANFLRLRWAILGPPVATVLMLGVLVVVGAVRGGDPDLWMRPAVLVPGGPLLLCWWQVVVRPRHRWWALGVAVAVTIGAYLLLYRLVLAELPFPWAGVVSFAVAGWLGAFAYVAVTQRPTMPFSRGKTEGSTIAPGEVYEERFGFTRGDLLLMPTSVVFVAVGVALLRDEPLPGLAVTVFGGVFLLLRLVSVLSCRVALRVDAAGVTLGQTPPWPSSHTAVVPWSDIEAVVLWTQQVGLNSVPYVGLQRRPGLPPLPGSARSRGLRRMNQALVPHVPRAVIADSRPATFWRLHRPSIEAAVRHFAPAVEIVDAG
ncbi:hypothetical protein [Micromonospora lupini]|uniref:Uncharacterized protein n=1 Tax=Micromonospora lupini str. Lupac 08 TaxID=1150864 RepID=I0KZF5_9ACTN|nr:hypothetical protein [Micromonospora lupini]CCH16952.1 conserved membrane hypothetical protein [Micromonospora lupini str. Lupac 08]